LGGRNDDVRANPSRLVGGALHLADHDGHNGEDHDDLDGHRKHADGGTHRTIQDVADHEFVHLDGWMKGAFRDGNNRVTNGGEAETKLSASE